MTACGSWRRRRQQLWRRQLAQRGDVAAAAAGGIWRSAAASAKRLAYRGYVWRNVTAWRDHGAYIYMA